jgi:hypothetical protein
MKKALLIGIILGVGMSSFAANKRTIRIKKNAGPAVKYKRVGKKTITTRKVTTKTTTVTQKRVIQEPAFATRVSSQQVAQESLAIQPRSSVVLESSVTEIRAQKPVQMTYEQDLKGLSASRAKHKENVAQLKKLNR